MAKEYRQKIISSELHDGDKLLSDSQLCELHNVSNITARSAVKLLREWGLAYRMKGKGVFVRRPAQLTRIAPQRYFRGQQARAYVREAEASTVGLNAEHETTHTTAPAGIATRLGIAPGDPVVLTRYFIRMGNPPQPVTTGTSWELACSSGPAPACCARPGGRARAGRTGGRWRSLCATAAKVLAAWTRAEFQPAG